MRPHPTSPLFPYTTLFRSISGECNSVSGRDGGSRAVRQALSTLWRDSAHSVDRKSTRLNSSHLGISYAVFCLKKKNNSPFSRHLQRRMLLVTILCVTLVSA